MFSFNNLDTSEFQSRGSNTLATMRASIISAIDTKAAKQSKKVSKIKSLALHKMVSSIEKKIMHRRMDFWLPFRVHSSVRKPLLQIETKADCNAPYDRNHTLKEKGRTIVESIQQTLQIPASPMFKENDQIFGDLSVIEPNTAKNALNQTEFDLFQMMDSGNKNEDNYKLVDDDESDEEEKASYLSGSYIDLSKKTNVAGDLQNEINDMDNDLD